MKYDEVGYWSEIKIDIIEQYASSYSKILANQTGFYHIYIDAFAGAGKHISKTSGEIIAGSPLKALSVQPPFREYHLIDLNEEKISSLNEIAGNRKDVFLYHGDCNQVLLKEVFPHVKYEDYRRALCLLDPYGLHLNWEIIYKAGQMKSIDIFLNFPVADMNRNVLRHNTETVNDRQIERMNAFWGDDSWRNIAYKPSEQLALFNELGDNIDKTDNETLAEGFRQRLKNVAGFKEVPKPLPMRNSKGATVYYLFFASQKLVAADIITYIFNKYQKRGIM